MSEVQCGFLTYHPPMDQFPSIVRYKGQWTPEALITRGGDKRFSDAELAAEYHANEVEAWRMIARHPDHYNIDHAEEIEDRERTLHRFATYPHLDQNQHT